MNAFQSFWYKFKNEKFKIFLLIIMYTVIFSIILLLLIFGNSLKKQTDFIEKYIENEVSIKATEKPIYEDTVKAISKTECIDEYNVYNMEDLCLEHYNPIIPDQVLYEKYKEERRAEVEDVWKNEFDEQNLKRMQLVETNNTKNLVFFLNKGFYLQEGRHVAPGDENVALISEEFAKTNHLKIGDKIRTVEMEDQYYYAGTLNMELKIVGIYGHSNDEFTGNPKQYYSNFIFTSLGSVSNAYVAAYETMTVYLKKGYSVDDLKTEIAEKTDYINVDNYCFQKDAGKWADIILEPLKNMQGMSTVLLIFMLGFMIVVIILIGAFYIRDNLRNIGILLSIGESRTKLVFQTVLEEFIPVIIGMLLAVLIGINGSDKVSDVIDHQYTSELSQLMESYNSDLTEGKIGTGDAVSELRTVGQVMRMDTDFTVDYSATWQVFVIYIAIVGVILPVCLAIQISYKIRYFTVKQILLS